MAAARRAATVMARRKSSDLGPLVPLGVVEEGAVVDRHHHRQVGPARAWCSAGRGGRRGRPAAAARGRPTCSQASRSGRGRAPPSIDGRPRPPPGRAPILGEPAARASPASGRRRRGGSPAPDRRPAVEPARRPAPGCTARPRPARPGRRSRRARPAGAVGPLMPATAHSSTCRRRPPGARSCAAARARPGRSASAARTARRRPAATRASAMASTSTAGPPAAAAAAAPAPGSTLGHRGAGHHRHAEAHGLQRREAVALGQRHVGKSPGPGVEAGQHLVGDAARGHHPVGDREPGSRRCPDRVAPARRADHHQRPGLGERRSGGGVGGHQPGEVLARLEGADVSR